jgi:tetratricopeptide (TPR) repeat protein
MASDMSHEQERLLVGAKIRAMRLARKMTQSQLAKPDFSISYISAIERGQIQPSLRALAILASRLGLTSTQPLTSNTTEDTANDFLLRGSKHLDEVVELELLEAQVAIRQDVIQEAIELLQGLTAKKLRQQQQARLYYLLGRAYQQIRQYEESKDHLLKAAQLAQDCGDNYIGVHVHSLLGSVYAATHNYEEALASYQRCLQLLRSNQLPSPLLKAQVYSSLGEHYLRLNQHDRANEMFQRAAMETADFATTEQRQVLYGEQCKYFTNTGQYYPANLYLYEYLYLDDQHSRLQLRSELYHYLCHAVMREDPERAYTYLEAAFQQEKDGEDQLTAASIAMHLGAWFFAHDMLTEAESHAKKAHKRAQHFGDTIIAAETSLLLGQIAYALSRSRDGDRYFLAGLEMLERLRKREELAEELVHYAQLLERHGRISEALAYFKRAYEARV